MSDLLPTLLLFWLLAFVIGAVNAFLKRTIGLSLMQAIGITWIIGRIFK